MIPNGCRWFCATLATFINIFPIVCNRLCLNHLVEKVILASPLIYFIELEWIIYWVDAHDMGRGEKTRGWQCSCKVAGNFAFPHQPLTFNFASVWWLLYLFADNKISPLQHPTSFSSMGSGGHSMQHMQHHSQQQLHHQVSYRLGLFGPLSHWAIPSLSLSFRTFSTLRASVA